MAKKKVEDASEELEREEEDEGIRTLDIEFGNGDLNLLRDKINEVIRNK